MKDFRLVLASGSPRRRELLEGMGFSLKVVVPNVDERELEGERPRVYVERLALEKARSVLSDDGAVVLAADTIVVLGEQILGKPRDEEEAAEMLRLLSGATHEVMTGVCIRHAVGEEVFSGRTEVEFRALSEEEIAAYVRSGCPMDKAGAYAIQGGAAHMVRAIRGSYTNVVGLPLCEVFEVLENLC